MICQTLRLSMIWCSTTPRSTVLLDTEARARKHGASGILKPFHLGGRQRPECSLQSGQRRYGETYRSSTLARSKRRSLGSECAGLVPGEPPGAEKVGVMRNAYSAILPTGQGLDCLRTIPITPATNSFCRFPISICL